MGTMRCPLMLLLLLLLIALGTGLSRDCPRLISSGCSCTEERTKGLGAAPARKKISCNGEELSDPPPASLLPSETFILILSNNRIRALRNGSFFGLTALEKLDLRNNLISTIIPGAFWSLTALRKLDLSNNRIGCLTSDMFQGLTNLTKLNLSGNIFSSLEPGLFQELPSLKLVNFNSEFLSCDCGLRWVPGYFRSSTARLGDETFCAYPRHLHGRALRGLREGMLTCDGPPELHTLSLLPSLRQVVFKGDRLPFHCTAALVGKTTTLHWRHNSQDVSQDPEQGVQLEDSVLHDCTFVTSELILSNVHVEASGIWECVVSTERGNVSRSVEIVVLENSASFCPEERVTNNRGEFRWPRTLAGITSYHSCLQLRHPTLTLSGGLEEKKASRYCNRSGRWEDGDYSHCHYTNDITRVLHTFTLMPINASNAVTLAHQVRPYTLEAGGFTDAVAVLYVAQLISRFMDYVRQQQELSRVLVEMGSNLMQVDDQTLSRAQREERACSSIVRSLETLAWPQLHGNSKDLSMVSRNIVMEAHLIRPAQFTGMSCTAYQRREGPGVGHTGEVAEMTQEQRLRFRCTTGSHNASLHSFPLKNSVALASVSLPASLFPPDAPPDCKLQFVAFRSGRFFPFTGNGSISGDHGRRRSVNTPVIYVGLDGCHMWNHSEPVIVSLRHSSPGSEPVAAHWSLQALEQRGGWSLEGCQLVHSDSAVSTLRCSLLSNYAVLQELPDFPSSLAITEVLHPVIYACTTLLLLCLFTIIITHILHHSSIHISRKSWHTLLNSCFHIAMTAAVFAGGVTLTRYPVVCQAVGIALHYSSLSTLLWICISARVVYKDAIWRLPQLQEGETPAMPIQRPMLRFYLIADGVPLIICGITAAVNINNYGDSSPYCWLACRPSLGAFFVPAGLVALMTWIIFLCTVVRLRGSQHLKETPGSNNSSPLPENQPALGRSSSLLSTDSAVAPALPPEDEHSLKARFWTLAATHVLFVALWGCGALAVWQAGRGTWPGLLFSCLYGALAVALGTLLLAQHCLRRHDVQAAWQGRCLRNRRYQQPGGSSSSGGSGSVAQGDTPDGGSQVFTADAPTSSSTSSSSSTGVTGSAPCKLTNLLQVAQDCSARPSTVTMSNTCANTSTGNNTDNNNKQTNNRLQIVASTTGPIQPQRRKVTGRTKHMTSGHHHRGEGRAHYRLKGMRGAGGGGSLGGLEQLPPLATRTHASSENGSLRHSHSESQTSPIINGRRVGETPGSPSEGSDGAGSSGGSSHKPFPLLPSTTSRRSASRDNLRLAADAKRCSYPLNSCSAIASPANGTLKGSVIELDCGTERLHGSPSMRSGVWKSETTV